MCQVRRRARGSIAVVIGNSGSCIVRAHREPRSGGRVLGSAPVARAGARSDLATDRRRSRGSTGVVQTDAEIFLVIHTHTARNAKRHSPGAHEALWTMLTDRRDSETDYPIPTCGGILPLAAAPRAALTQRPAALRPAAATSRGPAASGPRPRPRDLHGHDGTSSSTSIIVPSRAPPVRPPTTEPLMAVPAGSRRM